ncbi:MAG: PASTA domain-containing protein [Oscillospiraceae bacterium]|jgi:hypothetical protein|nr:PASTA domain-containing protein [Oscillospiraceae bacterium]
MLTLAYVASIIAVIGLVAALLGFVISKKNSKAGIIVAVVALIIGGPSIIYGQTHVYVYDVTGYTLKSGVEKLRDNKLTAVFNPEHSDYIIAETEPKAGTIVKIESGVNIIYSAQATPPPTPLPMKNSTEPTIAPADNGKILFDDFAFRVSYISGYHLNVAYCYFDGVNGEEYLYLSYEFLDAPENIDSAIGSFGSDYRSFSESTFRENVSLWKSQISFSASNGGNHGLPYSSDLGNTIYVALVVFDSSFSYRGNTIVQIDIK